MATEVLLVAGVGLVLTLPLVQRVFQRRFDPFEPIVLFALAWGVMFVVRPLAILIREDYVFFDVDIAPTLGRTILLAQLGAVGFVLGYELDIASRLARRIPTPLPSASPRIVLRRATLTGVLGLAALLTLLLAAGGRGAIDLYFEGRSPELNDLLAGSMLYLWWAALLTVPGALAAFIVALRTPTPMSVVVAVGLGALALVRLVPTGNRTFLLVFFGAMLVFAYVSRGRRPGPVALAVLLLAGLGASLVVVNARDAESGTTPSEVLEQVVRSPQRMLYPLIKGPDAEMAPALAGALTVVPSTLRYRYGGALFGDLARRPIPGSLWAGKPEPPGNQLVGVVWPEAKRLGDFDPAFTPMLLFYWDFGLVGVLVGMAVYGILARLLFAYFLRHAANELAQLLFAAGTLFTVIAVRFDAVFTLMHVVVLFAPLPWILTRRRPPEAVPSDR